jgi:hypothetical protein
MMEAMNSSNMSVLTRTKRHNFPENVKTEILHSEIGTTFIRVWLAAKELGCFGVTQEPNPNAYNTDGLA